MQEHQDTGARLIERVWSLHCLGKAVTEIGRRLGIEPDEARRIICAIWRADKGA